MSYRLRISPSGPFVKDGVSNSAIYVGTGSTGLIWRAQGQTPGAAALAIGTLDAPGILPDLQTTWAIPRGYHYDVKAKYKVSSGAPNTVGVFYVDIEANITGTGWTSIINYTVAPLPFSVEQHDVTEGGNDESYCYTVENVDWDLTAAGGAITGVRALITEDPALGMTVLQQQCNLRIEQYIVE